VPRTLVRASEHTRKRSLKVALFWIEQHCVHGPGDVQGQPVRYGDETAGFILDCYTLSKHGRRLYDSAFYSRPKGCDKSGMGARFTLLEALGPARFDGWAEDGDVYACSDNGCPCGWVYAYEPGEAMGRRVPVPYIRIMATEEGQTGHTYDTVYFNLTDESSPLSKIPGVDAGMTRVFLPGGGEITPSTASSSSKDGGKETFVVFDETHLYNQPELRQMYKTVTRNLRKRMKIAETWYLETTTMFAPGQESVAEATYKLSGLIKENQNAEKPKKNLRERLLLDHRWGECENLSAEDQLRAAILEAFGEAIDWNDIDAIVDEFYDPRKDPADSRRYFLNAVTEAADAWLAEHEIVGFSDAAKIVRAREAITLGFDGSRRRARGVTDATAIIGCRLSDGHLFEIRVWEQPEDEADWQVPAVEVEAEIVAAFKKYDVVGFYCDPAKWEQTIGTWEATYGSRLKVKATRDHPMQWWMTGGRATQTVKALERFHDAVVDKEITFGGTAALTRHLRNARRRLSRSGIQIAKSSPTSDKKIDAAVAAVLAFTARMDAVAAGITAGEPEAYVPKRIR
jgi:hypothetical protein